MKAKANIAKIKMLVVSFALFIIPVALFALSNIVAL